MKNGKMLLGHNYELGSKQIPQLIGLGCHKTFDQYKVMSQDVQFTSLACRKSPDECCSITTINTFIHSFIHPLVSQTGQCKISILHTVMKGVIGRKLLYISLTLSVAFFALVCWLSFHSHFTNFHYKFNVNRSIDGMRSLSAEI